MLKTIYLPKNHNFKKMVGLKVHGNLNKMATASFHFWSVCEEDLDKYFNYLYKNNLDCSLSMSMRDRSILQNLTSQQTNYQLDRIVILLKVSYLAG